MRRFHIERLQNGFTVFLAVLVTTILFFLVMGSRQIALSALDLGRSAALESVAFQAADGGLERGLGKLRRTFHSFEQVYFSDLSPHRRVEVAVRAVANGKSMDLLATATVLDGGRSVAIRCLSRRGISHAKGRKESGMFLEER